MKVVNMLVQSAIAYFMPAELSYPKSMEHYISVERNEKATEKFFLPELFLSSFLKTKINLYYVNKNALERVSQQPGDVDMPDSMPKSILRTSVQLQCELAELYIKASQEVPYELYETAGEFSGKVQSYMQENNAGLLEEVRKTITTITVLVATYDIKLLKLIFQMRHGLFFKTKIKLTEDLVIQLLSYYKELLFDENDLADIFLEHEPDSCMHYKIKCSIIFEINLIHLLSQVNLLEDFKRALFCEVSGSSEAPNKNKKNGLGSYFIACFISGSSEAPNKSKKNAFSSDFIACFKNYTCFNFMEPLFRIIAIEYKTKYRVDFPDGVKYVKYFCENGNQPALLIETSKSTKNSRSSVPFLEIFNERNYAYGNPEKLIAIIQEQKIPDLYKIIYSILKLFPKIRELNLVSIGMVSDLNCLNWFDRHIYLLLSKNESLMRNLTGFLIYGNYWHTTATIMLLKQYEFQKFGVRLRSHTSESRLLLALFEEETEESIEQYHKKKDIQLGDNYEEHSYEKYNRLRNSVRHFVGTESTIAFASMRSLIKNIQTATIYLHQSKTYHITILRYLYSYEFRRFREFVDCYGSKFMYDQVYSRVIREYPLQFEFLEVIQGPDLLEELIFDGVEPLAIPPSHDFETNIHIYELSKLAIINNELSTRTTCEVSFIDSVACDKGIFKIRIRSTDIVDINYLYKKFEIVNAANPSSRFKKIVLDLLIENFGYVPVIEKVIETDSKLMSMILRILDEYINISDETELIIRLSPLSHSGVNIALLRVQFYNFIYRTSNNEIVLRWLEAFERKIIFEQADSVKETCANALQY